MADSTLNIDVVDMTVPSGSPVNIAIINQPNPVKNYTIDGKQIQQLIQIPKYFITVAGTNTTVTGTNLYTYFPELNPSGGGGGGGGGGGSDNYTPIAPGPGETDDLDNYTDNGNYIVTSAEYNKRLNNIPPIIDGFVMTVFADDTSGYVRQEIVPLADSESKYIRTYDMNTDGWTSWYRYLGSDIGKGFVIGEHIGCLGDFYFNNEIVTCVLDGREYATATDEERIAIIVTWNDGYSMPVFFGRTPESVAYTENPGANGPVTYGGGDWYYSTNGFAMYGNLVDQSGNVAKYPENPPYTLDSFKAILKYVGAVAL